MSAAPLVLIKLLQTRVPHEVGEQVESAAAAAGMSVATWLRVMLIEHFKKTNGLKR